MPSSPLIYARAKRMRREPSEAERKLWGALRNRSLGGYKFYRQVPIGPYIVDFINHEFGVVVEVDGVTHSNPEQLAHDQKRTDYLQRQGLVIHRAFNHDVFQNLVGVCDSILLVLSERVARDLIRPSATFSRGEG
ncbi:MAG: endonuclease domain-containing protein [Alphaproteobacteria bacterium]|nr:endonuclease domain-containing protein [Alphaproteobacteria bacterium]